MLLELERQSLVLRCVFAIRLQRDDEDVARGTWVTVCSVDSVTSRHALNSFYARRSHWSSLTRWPWGSIRNSETHSTFNCTAILFIYRIDRLATEIFVHHVAFSRLIHNVSAFSLTVFP